MDNIKTVIYCESGWYGSPSLWRDPSYAFRHRKVEPLPYGTFGGRIPKDDWKYLGNDASRIAQTLGIDVDTLPSWDYEAVVLEGK